MRLFKLGNISNPEYISKININDIDTLRELYKNNNLVRVYDNNNLFEINIINNAYSFYYSKEFKNIKIDDYNYSAVALGTSPYNVLIEFDKNHVIKESTCTCPYYTDRNENCKHIYALLLKIDYENTVNKLRLMIKKELDNIDNKNHHNYINNIKAKYLKEDNTDKLILYYYDLLDIKNEYVIKPIKRKNGRLIVKL